MFETITTPQILQCCKNAAELGLSYKLTDQILNRGGKLPYIDQLNVRHDDFTFGPGRKKDVFEALYKINDEEVNDHLEKPMRGLHYIYSLCDRRIAFVFAMATDDPLHYVRLLMMSDFIEHGYYDGRWDSEGRFFGDDGHTVWTPHQMKNALTNYFTRFIPELVDFAIAAGMLEARNTVTNEPCEFKGKPASNYYFCSCFEAEHYFLEQQAAQGKPFDFALLDDEEKNAVILAINSGAHKVIAVNAKAGTGKTFLARHLMLDPNKKVMAVSLAGCAANNIRTGLPKNQGLWERVMTCQAFLVNPRIERPDLLIIDEAGMVGSKMMTALLKKFDCPVVLMGDMRQLPPITAGCPFVQSKNVFELSKNYRSDGVSQLDILKQKCLDGKCPETPELAACYGEWFADPKVAVLTTSRKAMDYFMTLRQYLFNGETEAFNALAKAYKELGPRKVGYVHEFDRWTDQTSEFEGVKDDKRVFLRPRFKNCDVIWSGKPYQKKMEVSGKVRSKSSIYAGMRGYIDEERCLRIFETDGNLKVFEKYETGELIRENKIQPAHTLNIHRAQGQEYDRVIYAMNQIDSVENAYTAVSRAKKQAVVVGTFIPRPHHFRNTSTGRF